MLTVSDSSFYALRTFSNILRHKILKSKPGKSVSCCTIAFNCAPSISRTHRGRGDEMIAARKFIGWGFARKKDPEESYLLQRLHLETAVPRRQALNLSPITAAISLPGRSLHALCFLLQAMAAGIICSGATMANVYSRFWCAIIVETATTTAMKCSRVVSIAARSFFICSALKIINIVRMSVI